MDVCQALQTSMDIAQCINHHIAKLMHEQIHRCIDVVFAVKYLKEVFDYDIIQSDVLCGT